MSAKHKPDRHSDKLRQWMAVRPSARRKRLAELLRSKGQTDIGITHLLHCGSLAELRRELVAELEQS